MLQNSEEINLLPFLNFTLVFNSGVAFGIFKSIGQVAPHIFSFIGVAFGLGLVIILVQNVLLRSINLNDWTQNNFKFLTKFQQKLNNTNSKYY